MTKPKTLDELIQEIVKQYDTPEYSTEKAKQIAQLMMIVSKESIEEALNPEILRYVPEVVALLNALKMIESEFTDKKYKEDAARAELSKWSIE